MSALHEGAWTLDEVQDDLAMLFERQYILTETVEVEVRYRQETRTGSYTYTDPDTGESVTEEYEYEVSVPYNYYICTVTLENFNLSHLPIHIMSEEQLSMYALYTATHGNRPDLFPQSQYPNASVLKDYTDYDIPRRIFGGRNFCRHHYGSGKISRLSVHMGRILPGNLFRLLGFVSYVINQCGWDVGRLGAQGLYNICTPVSAPDAKPGDLVFFVGTYDTEGVSHVAIYVGDGMMIQAGNPIGYADMTTSYWQSHFYSFGRLP